MNYTRFIQSLMFTSMFFLFGASAFCQIEVNNEIYPLKEKRQKYSYRLLLNDEVSVDEIQNYMKQRKEIIIRKNGTVIKEVIVENSSVTDMVRLGTGLFIRILGGKGNMTDIHGVFVNKNGEVTGPEKLYSYENTYDYILDEGISTSSDKNQLVVFSSFLNNKLVVESVRVDQNGNFQRQKTFEKNKKTGTHSKPTFKFFMNDLFLVVEEYEIVKRAPLKIEFSKNQVYKSNEEQESMDWIHSDVPFPDFEEIEIDSKKFLIQPNVHSNSSVSVDLNLINEDGSLENMTSVSLNDLISANPVGEDEVAWSNLVTDGVHKMDNGSYIICLKKRERKLKHFMEQTFYAELNFNDDLVLIEINKNGQFGKPYLIKRKFMQYNLESQVVLSKDERLFVFMNENPDNYGRKGYSLGKGYSSDYFSLSTLCLIEVNLKTGETKRSKLEVDGFKKLSYGYRNTIRKSNENTLQFGIYGGADYKIFELGI